MSNFYIENGYDVEITVGSLHLDTSLSAKEYGLCGDLTVVATCGVSSTAAFSFIPPEGPVNLKLFQGKEVHIIVRKNNVLEQIFFGYVDTPEVNFIERKITLNCTDSRQNRISKLPKSVIQGVGSFSNVVFGTPKDQAEELDRRLTTVASDFDFDRYGNYYLTPWLPKNTPDYVFNSEDISRNETPSIQYSNREKTVNVRNIEINYNYQRLHQQSCTFVWPGYDQFIRDWWRAGKPSFPERNSILSAATSTDWKISSTDSINFDSLWPAQSFPDGTGTVSWQPNDITNETKGRTKFAGYLKDGDGNFVTVGFPARLVPQYEPVLDSNGNQIIDVIKTTVRDTSSHLCKGAAWRSALKFTQNIQEKWTIQLRCPQAINDVGVVDSYETYSLTDPYDTSEWEKSDTIAQVNYNFYSDYITKRDEQHKALQVALNKARHDMLDYHRDVTLSWRFKSIQPQLDLRNTIEVTIDESVIGATASIHAKGRVFSINHYISFKSGEGFTTATLKLSQASGNASNDTWRAPIVNDDSSYIGVPTQISLSTYAGLDPDTTAGSDKWVGWICNKEIPVANGSPKRTEFSERFIIDFPAINDSLRDERVIYGDAVYNLVIPNDLLEVSF